MVRGPENRGTAAIEFALTLPIFLLLVFGILEYGWVMFGQHSLDAAARQGCREGAVVRPSPSAGEDASIASAHAVIGDALAATCSRVPCEVTVTIEGAHPDQMLSCQVRRGYTPLIGLLPTPNKLRASATSWLEVQR